MIPANLCGNFIMSWFYVYFAGPFHTAFAGQFKEDCVTIVQQTNA
jgi:hypothetical protein